MALRNILLGLCILALLSPSPVTAQEKSRRKPNILIIVADDLGQQKDVALENPAVVGKLQAAFERWNAELPRAKKKKDGKGGGTP